MLKVKPNIAELWADKVWPAKPAHSVGCIVSPEHSDWLQEIEEEVFQLVQSVYPDTVFIRNITVRATRQYVISIEVDEKRHGSVR